MIGRLGGKTAILTAAGHGIGAAVARAFASEGARVLATDIDLDAVEKLAENQPNCTAVQLDVTDAGAIAALAKEVGPADVLFNCAGMVNDGPILQCTSEEWQQAWALNVGSMFHMIQSFLPAMVEQGGGSIINVASVASSITGVANRFAYGTTKAAVIGLTKSVARDYVGQGIRCNAICPGTIETPSLLARVNAFPDPELARKQFNARQPMGRLGRADEVAALAVYLASDESAFTTGTTQVVDGGWTI